MKKSLARFDLNTEIWIPVRPEVNKQLTCCLLLQSLFTFTQLFVYIGCLLLFFSCIGRRTRGRARQFRNVDGASQESSGTNKFRIDFTEFSFLKKYVNFYIIYFYFFRLTLNNWQPNWLKNAVNAKSWKITECFWSDKTKNWKPSWTKLKPLKEQRPRPPLQPWKAKLPTLRSSYKERLRK